MAKREELMIMTNENQNSDLVLSSPQKAAVLVRMFSNETAQNVVSYLTREEKQTLIRELYKLPDFETNILLQVADEYLRYFKSKNLGNMTNGIEYVKELFKDIPEKDLEKMLGSIYQNIDNPFEFLNYVRDVEPLLSILIGEDAQTIATVATHIDPKIAAEILQKLPEEKMMETVLAISKMGQLDNELLFKMGKMLENKIGIMSSGGVQAEQDGIKKIVNILNNIQRSTERVVLDKLDIIDPELAQEIKENLFTFDDLVKIDDLQMQKVLNEIQDISTLAKAMKLAKEELKEKLFKCMSEGRREMVSEEIDGMPPLRLVDAEAAQQTIAQIVKQLEKDGKIQLARGEEDVIL